MQTILFEPMSVGRILDRAFAIYRNNFLRFVTIVALIDVPIALISTASSSWVGTKVPARQRTMLERMRAQQDARSTTRQYDTSAGAPSPFSCLGTAVTVLLTIVGAMLCQAALIKSVSETYLGNEITIGQAYRFILPKSLTLVVATIFVTLVTWLGLMLFVVPGVIFGLWFSLTTPAIVAEGHSATNGMSRSKALVAGNLGKVFAVGLLATLIAYVILLPLSYLGGLAGRMLFADHVALVSFMRHFAATVGQILATPISAAASILLYYDLRIRKEGFDLQMLAQSMTSEQGQARAS